MSDSEPDWAFQKDPTAVANILNEHRHRPLQDVLDDQIVDTVHKQNR